MRQRATLFVVLVVLSVGLLPMMNIIGTGAAARERWYSREFLFNMDLVERGLSIVAYPLGVSIDPDNVVIGRDGWLFLGDRDQRSITTPRGGQGIKDRERGARIIKAINQWHDLLRARGVRHFSVMVAPNKSSIYPEHLPQWAQPVTPGATDALFQMEGSPYLIDLRSALLNAKSSYAEPLFYKTDTHWNPLGATLAFREFARASSGFMPDVRWPVEQNPRIQQVLSIQGGDLSRFLRISDLLVDATVEVEGSADPLPTEHIDYPSGEARYNGPNVPVDSPKTPLLVVSPQALNKARVLWLRDSFGTLLSPLMAATFDEVLQLHWDKAMSVKKRTKLIDTFKPDYVFVTISERFARKKWLTLMPEGTDTRDDDERDE